MVGGVSSLSVVGLGGGGVGWVVAVEGSGGQGKVAVCKWREIMTNKHFWIHKIILHVPVDIEMTGAARVKMFKTPPLLPTE